MARSGIVTWLSRRVDDSGRMDIIAILIAVAAFALLIMLVEGLDRV
jgi:hypothetical protein